VTEKCKILTKNIEYKWLVYKFYSRKMDDGEQTVNIFIILEKVLEKYSAKDAYPFIKELAWRDYFQKVWEAKGDEIFSDLKH
jgi:deoxyribodipyrimidine photolyase